MRSVLMVDAAHAPFTIIGLEKRVSWDLTFELQGKPAVVNIGGYIDRMDLKEGRIRIIDYKSGNPALRFRELEDLFNTMQVNRPKEILQALIYCLLVSEADESGQAVYPAIYPTGKMRSSTFNPCLILGTEVISDISGLKEDLRDRISALLSELFNPDVPFHQTDNEKNCLYCPFSDYCHR